VFGIALYCFCILQECSTILEFPKVLIVPENTEILKNKETKNSIFSGKKNKFK